jgi:hypothetical protein
MRWLAIAGLVIVHACTCGDVGVGTRRYACGSTADCADGFLCVEGECVASSDAGSSEGMDAGPGMDAGRIPDAGGAPDAGAIPDFSLGAVPSAVTALYCGDDPTSAVNVAPLNGFSGTVTLSVSGNPTGSVAGISPTSLAGGSGSSTLTLTVGSAVPGSYSVQVRGTSGSLQHSTTVTYSVPGPLFADDFNRSTGLGSNWTVPYGSYSTSTTGGGSAVSGSPPTQGNWAAVVPNVGTNDYCVAANVMVPSSSTDSGIVARSIGGDFTSDLYAAQLWGDGNVYLYRRNNWNWTQLASNNAGAAGGSAHDLRLIVGGSSPTHLEVWLDGSRQITIDDSTDIASGIPGMENYVQNVQYEAFRVYPQ